MQRTISEIIGAPADLAQGTAAAFLTIPRSVLRLFAALGAALLFLSALTLPAAANHGSFQICNDESTEYQVAIVYRSGFGLLMDDWTAKGWYTIPPRGCLALFQPMSDALQMYVGVRAKGAFGYGDVAAPTFRTSGGFGQSVSEALCVIESRFDRKGPKWSHGLCSDPWVTKRFGIYLDVPAIPLRQHYSNVLTLTGGSISGGVGGSTGAIGWWPFALGAVGIGAAMVFFRRRPAHAGAASHPDAANGGERVRRAISSFPIKSALLDAIVSAVGIGGVVMAVTTFKLANFSTSASLALSLATFFGIPTLVALVRRRFRVGEVATWGYTILVIIIALALFLAVGAVFYATRGQPV